ncbi:hypothetical protein [Streptomyces bluensis]|uniref:Uncharacterized protein n=1 Tax=Streptomyces bluensis TaxID=33897 RepID=A0ABW6UY34_9ACTN
MNANGNPAASAAESLVQELHRRASRLEELRRDRTAPGDTATQVWGEVIGLRGALGIILGGTVPGGSADQLGYAYYREWLAREDPAG